MLPTIVDSAGVFGTASALPGSPALAALVGDQQASLVGQGCVQPGLTKITFGTGGMLDVCGDSVGPASTERSDNGTFPIVAWSFDGRITYGVEAVMLSAGTAIDWLREDLQLIETSAESHDLASQCEDAGGVMFVPALLGLGTPRFDYGARGTLLGLTRGTERKHIVRAVLEGVAQRGADMVDAAEAETGLVIPSLRVDGGMSQNPTFVQALANAAGKRVEVSPVVEATTLGAGYLAGIATGTWGGMDDIARVWAPSQTMEPTAQLDRSRWARAIEHSSGWIPELSALDF
jgi:glycerol kinase